jgi:hypothetical protein
MPASKASILDHMLLDENRQASRFVQEPGTDFAVVWQTTGETLLVEVHDESLTGLGVFMTDVASFPVGAEATIVYHGSVLHGEVKHLEHQPGGAWLVGWECHS